MCRQCATRPDDWAEDRFAMVADPVRCIGCETVELEREQVPAGERGIYIGLIPREVAEARELSRGATLDGGPADEDASPVDGEGLL